MSFHQNDFSVLFNKLRWKERVPQDFDGFVQYCSISSAFVMAILQFALSHRPQRCFLINSMFYHLFNVFINNLVIYLNIYHFKCNYIRWLSIYVIGMCHLNNQIPMAYWKTSISPLLMYWRHCSLVLSLGYVPVLVYMDIVCPGWPIAFAWLLTMSTRFVLVSEMIFVIIWLPLSQWRNPEGYE